MLVAFDIAVFVRNRAALAGAETAMITTSAAPMLLAAWFSATLRRARLADVLLKYSLVVGEVAVGALGYGAPLLHP